VEKNRELERIIGQLQVKVGGSMNRRRRRRMKRREND